MTPRQRARLADVVLLADTGVWGEDPSGGDGGVPVLRSTNIDDYTLDLSDAAFRRLRTAALVDKRLASGDILVTTSSGSPQHLGKCCLFLDPQDGHKYYFSNFTLRLRPDVSRIEPRWLFYWLSSSVGRRTLLGLDSTTSGLRNLNRGRYLSQSVPLPALPEQRRIAALLDKADAIRRKRQQALRLADDLLRSAFLDMFGDPVSNPRRWPTMSIGEVAAEKGAIVDGPFGSSLKPECYVDQGVTVVRNFNILDDSFDGSAFKYVTPSKFEQIRRSEVRPGDVVLSTKGTIGNVCLMPDLGGLAVLSASGTVRIRAPHQGLVRPQFLVSQMINSRYKRYLRGLEAGSNQKYLNLAAIRSARLVVPPLEQQDRFLVIRQRVRSTGIRLDAGRTSCDVLFESLVHRAFCSDL